MIKDVKGDGKGGFFFFFLHHLPLWAVGIDGLPLPVSSSGLEFL